MEGNLTKKIIKKAIRDLLKTFSEYPDIFLTENDVCCYLFAILIKSNLRLLRPQKTRDASFSIPIHSGIRWYGSSGKLRYLSDIVLLKPKDLRVKDRSSLRLPSKGYVFNSYYGIIEIKLRRVNGYSNNEFLKRIEKDVIKLKNIRKETKIYNKIKKPVYCLVCLDKKHDIRNDIEKIVSSIIRPEENIFLKYIFQKSK